MAQRLPAGVLPRWSPNNYLVARHGLQARPATHCHLLPSLLHRRQPSYLLCLLIDTHDALLSDSKQTDHHLVLPFHLLLQNMSNSSTMVSDEPRHRHYVSDTAQRGTIPRRMVPHTCIAVPNILIPDTKSPRRCTIRSDTTYNNIACRDAVASDTTYNGTAQVSNLSQMKKILFYFTDYTRFVIIKHVWLYFHVYILQELHNNQEFQQQQI